MQFWGIFFNSFKKWPRKNEFNTWGTWHYYHPKAKVITAQNEQSQLLASRSALVKRKDTHHQHALAKHDSQEGQVTKVHSSLFQRNCSSMQQVTVMKARLHVSGNRRIKFILKKSKAKKKTIQVAIYQ